MENPNCTPNRNEMIDITDDNYRTIAAILRDELQTTEWYNAILTGTLQSVLPAVDNVTGTSGIDIALECGCSRPAVEWRLVLSAIVYRRTEQLPEGARRPIADVVPVWWEFHTVGADGPVSNNFSFSELKPFLIDYD